MDNPRLCTLCPRKCRANREGSSGFCGEKNMISVSRAALYYGEEPCITGASGTGAIFFTGCSLRCVYCQNGAISGGGGSGEAVSSKLTPDELREVYFSLIEQGASSIDLVTPTHFTDGIAESLRAPLPVPVVWNSSGYESPETLGKLEGLVSVYMPDFKYSSPLLAEEYSGARDYPETADAAIREMIRQRGTVRFAENGILESGVLVRHLVLPGAGRNTRGVIDTVSAMPKSGLVFSLMSQYTPNPGIEKRFPELGRTLTPTEYRRACEYLELSAIENYYTQELDSAGNDFLPSFDGTGVADI